MFMVKDTRGEMNNRKSDRQTGRQTDKLVCRQTNKNGKNKDKQADAINIRYLGFD